MKRNLVVSAVVVVCCLWSSITNADLYLTVDSQNPTGIPLMFEGIGPYQVALYGNTIIEPNNIRLDAIGGTLTVISDVNHRYSFQYDSGSTGGFTWLITNVDMIINDINIPANTTIYEIFIFCNPDVNLTGVCGSDYSILYPPQEEEGQDESLIEESNEQSGIVMMDENQSFLSNDYNTPFENTENNNEEQMTMLIETSNPGIPLYVQNSIKKVQTFKQGGSGKDIIIINEVNQSYCFDNKKIYYISNPPLVIQGNIKVYIPSDTIFVVEYAPDSNSIVVQNGANVIAGISNGQNNNSGLNPPVWIVSISEVPFHHNLCGLSIKQSAKSESLINNIFVNNCKIGIETRTLDNPLSNIYAEHCYNGIIYHGSGIVCNCQVTNFGKIVDGIFPFEGRGIEFVPTDTNGSELSGSILYETYFNTVYNGDLGIAARDTSLNYANMKAYNNATVKCSKYAYDVILYWTFNVYNCGLYDNFDDANQDYVTLTNRVDETTNPAKFLMGDYKAYLDVNSIFVNKSDTYDYDSEQPGKSPFIDGKPDSNLADIWVHHQTRKFTATADIDGSGIVDSNDTNELMNYWLASETISDIDGDGQIGLYDLEIIAVNWLKQGTYLGDLNADSIINFKDLAICGNKWQTKNYMYADLNGDKKVDSNDYNIITASQGQLKPSLILTQIDGTDVNKSDVNGLIYVNFNNFSSSTYAVALYVDNVFIEKYVAVNRYPVELPSYLLSNGRHKVQCISYDSSQNATILKPVDLDFNNVIYYCDINDMFHPSESFPISGFTDHNSVHIKLISENNDILWSQDINGSGKIEANILGSAFNNQQICTLSLSGSGSTNIEVSKCFRPSDWPSNAKMAIILPNKEVRSSRYTAVQACIDACNRRNIPYLMLYNHDVTEENLRTVLMKETWPSIRYVYWAGHSNSFVDANRTIQRTNLAIWKYEPRWFKRNWQKRNAYSSMAGLPDRYSDGFDMRYLRMYGNGIESTDYNKKLVVIDGCLSAEYPDMVYIFGAYSYANCDYPVNHDQIYLGWTILLPVKEYAKVW